MRSRKIFKRSYNVYFADAFAYYILTSLSLYSHLLCGRVKLALLGIVVQKECSGPYLHVCAKEIFYAARYMHMGTLMDY